MEGQGAERNAPAEQRTRTTQRYKALDVLNGIIEKKPESVAAIAKRPLEAMIKMGDGLGRRIGQGLPVGEDIGRWIADLESGEIGDHYEKDVPDLLARPPTDANLRELAHRETEFWNSDRGGTAGAWLFDEDRRYNWLLDSRSHWLAEFPPAEQERIGRDLGLR